ncbi:MAG: hypothetical protein ACFFDT_15945, partial [Candidatus Hodarchaeota archaeon]
EKGLIQKYSLFTYFVLTHVITWICLYPSVNLINQYSGNAVPVPIGVFLYGSILSTLVTGIANRRENLQKFNESAFNWFTGIKCYFVVFLSGFGLAYANNIFFLLLNLFTIAALIFICIFGIEGPSSRFAHNKKRIISKKTKHNAAKNYRMFNNIL